MNWKSISIFGLACHFSASTGDITAKTDDVDVIPNDVDVIPNQVDVIPNQVDAIPNQLAIQMYNSNVFGNISRGVWGWLSELGYFN